jgi:hypothetical protein
MKKILALLFGFFFCICGQMANAGTDYCSILSFQESKLSPSQKQDLKNFGIIRIDVEDKNILDAYPTHYKKERLSVFLISKDVIADCATRIMIARHFENVENYGFDYYQNEASLREQGVPFFEVKQDFVVTHGDIIAELAYRLLSPHYYDYTNRLKGVLTEYEFPLLGDDRFKKQLDIIRKKLAGEGVKYQPI